MFAFLKRNGERTESLRAQITELERDRDRLKDRNRTLDDRCHEAARELADIKESKQKELDEIAHVSKMRDEARDLEFKGKEMDLRRECDEKVAKVKDEYRDKMEKQLGAERDNIKDMYTEVLGRLPKVSVRQLDSSHHESGDGSRIG